ncbi:hypothetical protein CC85DRAFT_303950 [Cutaneotrichosporon oleaginosum]|uniref:ARM repeat-containing protein n=1 Tax=Cutaneotrichosporon oleaginosum TaxID=879819 RepID=A0A0J0XHU2_9TREE|nr:uncharacterized protein CC85DRAFT_303950 [Cutaneotrichosporon oleaginosum]KLT40643.1 hypothetical protein CC85DRAFT_303950 [Cutaneotrichosporon oleaginosum]TXT12453.1 hypothetical protein COLE_02863 [Cutaneotrichosporon oleaginosum]
MPQIQEIHEGGEAQTLRAALSANDGSATGILDGLAVKLRDAKVREGIGASGVADVVAEIAGTTPLDEALLFQAARVAGNLAADCDANRDRLVAAGYPQKISACLKNDLEVKTLQAIAASLLNLVTDGHAAAVAALSDEATLERIIRAANTLYTPGEWDGSLRGTVASWLWNVVQHVVPAEPTYTLTLSLIKAFLPPLRGVMPRAAPRDLEDADDAFATDIAILTHATKVLERFNGKDKLEYTALLGARDAITTLLGFMEEAAIPLWLEEVEEDTTKALGVAKADVSRTLVNALSEGGDVPPWLLERLGSWLERPTRPDLVSVALLAYGNVARGDASATSILEDNPALLPRLTALLDPSTPVIVQHALVGLLRNLAIPQPNKRKLGDAGVLPRLLAMEPWAAERDMLGSVQGGAVGIVKQLVRNETNATQFLSLPLDPLHALITRTNDPAIALEATRVWVNCIRALGQSSSGGWTTLTDGRVLDALTSMLSQGARHPILLNEAVLALALLAGHGGTEGPGDGNREGVRAEIARRLLDAEAAQRAKKEHPNANLEGVSGADVLARTVAGQGARETQGNALALVKLLDSPELTALVRAAVAGAKGELVDGAREL